MARQPSPGSDPQPPGIEQSLEALEAIVKRLESGEETLDNSIKLFEEGMRLSAGCRQRLTEAEARVEMLIREAGADRPVPFEPEDE